MGQAAGSIVVAITGGARGIGRATAEALRREGARVAIGDLDAELARAAAAALESGAADRQGGPAAAGFELDVADAASFERFLDEVEKTLGAIDVLVNNAGVLRAGPFLEEPVSSSARMIDVNLVGTMHGMRLALARMAARRHGQIVNVISSAAFAAPPGEATYAATKHAVRALTDAVREEVRDAGVVVTAIYPGFVDTELFAGTRASRGSQVISPEDVAQTIASAVRDRRTDAFVPRSMGPLLRLGAGLPTRARSLIGRLLGVDRVAVGIDPSTRSAYEARAFSAGRGSDAGDAPATAANSAARSSETQAPR